MEQITAHTVAWKIPARLPGIHVLEPVNKAKKDTEGTRGRKWL